MGAALDRRAMLGGTIAAVIAPTTLAGGLAPTPTLGERQMRRKLCERLVRRSMEHTAVKMLDSAWEDEVLVEGHYCIARNELIEFDHGLGPWHTLAQRFPFGIPHRALGIARVRDILEGDVSWSTEQARKYPDLPKEQDRKRKAVAALAEFERGEGSWWRVVEARPNEL